MTSLAAELVGDHRRRRSPPRACRKVSGGCRFPTGPTWRSFSAMARLAAAKAAKANPRAIAEKIAARLKADPIFSQGRDRGAGLPEPGPVTDAALAQHLSVGATRRLGAPQTGNGKTMVIDFGGANIAKPMACRHHLRSSIIGDCLQRLYRANGLDGGQRRASGRLGPADGPADHRRSRSWASRRSISIVNVVGPYPARIARQHGRSGNDLSARFRRLQVRSGAAGSGAARHGGPAGRDGPAIAPCGGISSRCRKRAWRASSARWA